MPISRRAMTLLLAGAASIPLSPQLLAQTDEGAIVVTAQKREQNIQDVPVAVQVVGQAQLEANGVRDFADLNRVAPSLVVRPAENPVNANVSIRGVGTLAYSPGVEPSVAVIVDDVPISFQARAFADLADVQRIEVLRGPQSTLYGKSASAGLINIVTPDPSSSFTAKIAGTLTTDDQQQVNAVLSGPITPTLGFRSSVNYDRFGGNVRNIARNKDVNGRELFSARNKVSWDPTDDLNLLLSVDYLRGKTTVGRPLIALSPNARLRNNASYTPHVFAPGITPGADNTTVSNDFQSGSRYHDFAQALRISYDTGGPTLMSITSHDFFKLYDDLDSDESAIAGFDNRQFGFFKSEQWTQEFRIVSPGAGRFRYTLGLFFADLSFQRDFQRGPLYSLSSLYATTSSRQLSAFGQLEYDLREGTSLIAGGRISREKIDYSFTDRRANNAFFSGNNADTFGTFKLGVQQDLVDDVMMFLTYATGYKGQAYDLGTGFNQLRADAGPVRPETSKDWQLGLRSQFFDRKLTFNLTLFNTQFKGFQAQGLDIFPDGSLNFRLTNVGKLRTRGIEVETTVHAADNLNFGGAVTYLDAVMTEFVGASCYPGQNAPAACASQDLSGRRAPQAPRWKISANADYSHSLGSAPFELAATGAYTYQSAVNYSLSQDPLTVQKGYAITNVALGIRDADRRWDIMAFVNNLFDVQYRSMMANQYGNYGNQLALQGYVPRDFRRYGGVRASLKF